MQSISGGVSVSETIVYSTAGSVQANDGLYIPRKADDELLALCRARIFAYIIATRHIGKTSLMIHTMNRLIQENIRSVAIDLNRIGTGVTAEQWYLGHLIIIQEQLALHTNVITWWSNKVHLSLVQRLIQFFREVLLAEIKQHVVMFV